MVPRTPLGGCTGSAGCGPQGVAASPVAPAAVATIPADADRQLADAATAIAAVEAQVPLAQAALIAAAAAARAASSDSTQAAALDVAAGGFDAVFIPLSITQSRLDTLEDAVTGRLGGEAVLARVAALRARISVLSALRDQPR